jgi:hypothetical protein
MQLGLTIPLQKFLKAPAPPYGSPADLLFCWELHRVEGLGRSTFIAVNASNRYALVFVGMKAGSWKHLDELLLEAIPQAFANEGYLPDVAESYLTAAGIPEFTKTHGRKPVAGLNRVVDVLCWMDKPVDDDQTFQPHISLSLNEDICRAAGFAAGNWGYPYEFLARDLARVGIISEKEASAKLKPAATVQGHQA